MYIDTGKLYGKSKGLIGSTANAYERHGKPLGSTSTTFENTRTQSIELHGSWLLYSYSNPVDKVVD